MSHQAGLNPVSVSSLEPSSMQNEESFIVIARSSSPNGTDIPEVVNGPTSVQFPAALHESTTTSGTSSMLNGLSPDEIQNKLHALVEENGQLKDALQQNNLAMKKQFDTLVMWQDEVYKAHQNHKLKFEETKDLVLKLRSENAELRKVVVDLQASQQSSPDLAKVQAENASLKRRVEEAEAKEKVVCLKEFQLKKEIAGLTRQVEELQKKLSQFQGGGSLGSPSMQRSKTNAAVTAEKEELGGSGNVSHLGLTAPSGMGKPNSGNSFIMVDENWRNLPGMVEQKRTAEEESIRRQLDEAKKILEVERHALEEDRKVLEKNRRTMGDKIKEEERLKKKAELERDNISIQLAEALQQLTQERECNKELMKTLEERLKESVPHAYGNWELVHSATNERGEPVKACESRLGLIREYLLVQEKKNIKIEVWMQKLHQIIVSLMAVDPSRCKELKEEVLNLKKQISDDANELQEQRGHLHDAENLLADLKVGFDTIKAKEASVSSVIKENAEADYHKAQARGYRQQLDDVTARLTQSEEALGNARSDVVSLAERLRRAETQLEEIPILKTQVDIYQTDFNTEREERARMAADKQQLVEEVHRLRARNQQLMDDMENLERREAQENRSPPDGIASTSTPAIGVYPRMTTYNTLAAPGRGSHQAQMNAEPEQRQATPDRSTRGSSEPKLYTCPKCFKVYMELGPLEVHVNQCLDNP